MWKWKWILQYPPSQQLTFRSLSRCRVGCTYTHVTTCLIALNRLKKQIRLFLLFLTRPLYALLILSSFFRKVQLREIRTWVKEEMWAIWHKAWISRLSCVIILKHEMLVCAFFKAFSFFFCWSILWWAYILFLDNVVFICILSAALHAFLLKLRKMGGRGQFFWDSLSLFTVCAQSIVCLRFP